MPDRSRGELAAAIELACKPQNTEKIVSGRNGVLAFDRDFVLRNIESVAKECLDLSDYWEYRRLLEVCDMLDRDLTRRVAIWGIDSDDEDVHEAAADFLGKAKVKGEPE